MSTVSSNADTLRPAVHEKRDAMLRVLELHHEYRPGAAAIGSISFDVYDGELVSVVGPSGCGKSTLMKSISGLLRPTSGSVTLFGEHFTGVPDGLSMVFQDYGRSLFPWLNVWANIELPLKYRPISKAERRERVAEALQQVGLLGERDKFPRELSGGMQQRVAIARALAPRPRLLLMDEPFASVDAQTRLDLEDLVNTVHRSLGVTTIFVTHDIDEAVYLGDRVVVLSRPPSTKLREVVVGLPADRDQIATKASEEFVELRTQVAQLIRRPSVDG